MKKFKDLKFTPNPYGFGFHSAIQFKNGYEVSIVCGSFHYCSPQENLYDAHMYDTYEVAVLKDGDLCYDNPITDDVLGYQTPENIIGILKQIQML